MELCWSSIKHSSPSTKQFECYCRSSCLLQPQPITVHTLLLITLDFISSPTYLNHWWLTPGRSQWSLLELPTATVHLTSIHWSCVFWHTDHISISDSQFYHTWHVFGNNVFTLSLLPPFLSIILVYSMSCVWLTTASSSLKNIFNLYATYNTYFKIKFTR